MGTAKCDELQVEKNYNYCKSGKNNFSNNYKATYTNMYNLLFLNAYYWSLAIIESEDIKECFLSELNTALAFDYPGLSLLKICDWSKVRRDNG